MGREQTIAYLGAIRRRYGKYPCFPRAAVFP